MFIIQLAMIMQRLNDGSLYLISDIISAYFRKRHVPTGLVQAPSFLSADGANPKEMTAPLSSWLSPKEQISSSQ